MKIIELLNKIANGEEVPKKINFCRRNFEYKKDIYDYLCIDENFDKTEDYCLGVSICKWIFPSMLNDEVEILEEKKKIPEKLPEWATSREDKEYTNDEYHCLVVARKVDEIIDYLKSKGDE